MSRVKAVTFAFLALRESAHSPVLAQLVKSLFSSGQKLVGIRLMPDIPDKLILRQIQKQMQRHGQLDHAQIRRKMSPGIRDFLD